MGALQEIDGGVPLVTFFRLYEGDETAEGFVPIHEETEARATKFWGVERGKGLMVPDNLGNRLLHLKKILLKFPNLEEETANLARVSPDAINRNALKMQARHLKLPKNLKTDELKTYGDAYEDSGIRRIVQVQLEADGNPVIEVVRSMESWRQSAGNIGRVSLSATHKGREAFEMFTFGVGGDKFLQTLGSVALREIEQREAMSTSNVFE